MTPVRYSIKEGITHFHYNYKDLIKFARDGFCEGNNGMILMRREGNLLMYRGFGTYASPCKVIRTFSIVYFEPFQGKMPTDDERLIPEETIFTKGQFRIRKLGDFLK